MSAIKHTLFHQARGKVAAKPAELSLTVEQAAHLLKKKLVQKTGTMPGQVNYHSNTSLQSLKKAIKEVDKKSVKA
jgi:hypothetical protein